YWRPPRNSSRPGFAANVCRAALAQTPVAAPPAPHVQCPHADEAALRLSERVLAAGRARARAGGDQPDLLAPRSADLPPRHRRLRDEIPGVLDPAVLSRREPAARRGRGGRLHLARREELPGL